ncbi:hypothetical protein [Jeongeupia sp. USM3]|uniref:hypothetical protein n=1 Tax=Jeongeupia sp. USM3 TaxID=1906741 RepID=UPI00089DE897|nr:hypothetical protein [Jeongeupia sp. USM3]AOY00055.1 hypothetical protein BJP62_06080 [Jeongeupia sp. USM3]
MGSDLQVQRFTTGWRLVFLMQLMLLGVCVWMSWDVYYDPYGGFYQDLPGIILFNFCFFFMSFVIAAGIGVQRVWLDRGRKKLVYANYSTCHRWKEVDVADVQRVSIWSASRSTEALVDSLLVVVRSHQPDRPPAGVTLLDYRITPVNRKSHSPLFVAVIDFIRESNPDSDLPVLQ